MQEQHGGTEPDVRKKSADWLWIVVIVVLTAISVATATLLILTMINDNGV